MRLRIWIGRITAAVALLILLPPASLQAQSAPSSDTTFVSLLQGTELGIGALLQVDGTAGRADATDSFNLRVARFRFRGTAHRLQFFVQTEFNSAPAVLDTRLRFAVSDAVSVAAGLYKAPFSAEFLLFRGDLPFLERSRVVNALAPKRQTGVSLRADLLPGRLQFEGGVFNGNGGQFRLNDNDSFLYVGRLTGIQPLSDNGQLAVSANVAYSQDESVALSPLPAPFAGRRTLLGLDARLQWQQWLLAAEGITAHLNAADGPTHQPAGYYVTTGYRFTDHHQALVRLDALYIQPNDVVVGLDLEHGRVQRYATPRFNPVFLVDFDVHDACRLRGSQSLGPVRLYRTAVWFRVMISDESRCPIARVVAAAGVPVVRKA